MDYLLDSDTIIDVLRTRGSGIERFENVKNQKLFLSIISWMEIEYGLKKPQKLTRKQNIFDNLVKSFKIQIVPLNESVGEKYVQIKIALENKKTPLSDFDMIIAATALENGLALITGNVRHFERVDGLKINAN